MKTSIGQSGFNSTLVITWLLSPFVRLVASARGRFKKNNICLLHSGRCGSTVLGDLLGKHNSIQWEGELLGHLFYDRNSKSFRRSSRDFGDIRKLINLRMKTTVNKYFGFELKRVHLECVSVEISDFIDYLRNLGFDYFILLERKNHLRTILSYTIARQSGNWHVHRTDKLDHQLIQLNLDKVYLEYDEMPLLDALGKMSTYYDEFRNTLRNRGINYLDLTYEVDILNDPYQAYSKILNFIHIKPSNPKIRFRKTNPFKVSELISNFDELSLALKNTPYAWMLSA